MDVTPEHITRIADFVDARINEQFASEHHASRHWDKDPVARSLRALSRAVGQMRSARALDPEEQPELHTTISFTRTFAWGTLASVAKEWDDHPDYLPEFALLAHQLNSAAAATEAP